MVCCQQQQQQEQRSLFRLDSTRLYATIKRNSRININAVPKQRKREMKVGQSRDNDEAPERKLIGLLKPNAVFCV